MSQADELARVKARIKALAEKTVSNGCTEAEAMSAADMVGRLLERYALTMEEIDVRQSRCVQVEMPTGSQRRRPIDGCMTALARFCDCKIWVTRKEDTLRYVFFGFESDTAMAGYLYAIIDRAMATALQGFRAQRPRRTGAALRQASTSFQHGMAARIAQRLEAAHAEREASVAAARSTGTALMLVKHQVVEAAFRATDVRLYSARSASRAINSAFRDGQAAGERVNLHRPLGETARGLLAG
jgi:hypothetical protein